MTFETDYDFKSQDHLQGRAYKELFSEGQIIYFQDTFNSPPIAASYNQLIIFFHDKTKFPHQFIVLNPFLKDIAPARDNSHVQQIQSITIEQDIISKELQKEWFLYYFPDGATVTVDSGHKSIHHHIRFENPISQAQKNLLVDDIKKAFPFSDHNVLSNNVCLVRNPAGIRDNGNAQEILSVGNRYDYAAFRLQVIDKIKGINENKITDAKSVLRILYKCKKDKLTPKKIENGLQQLIEAGYSLSDGNLMYKAFLENFAKNDLPVLDLDAHIKNAKKNITLRPSNKTSGIKPLKTAKILISEEATEKLSKIQLIDIITNYYPGTEYHQGKSGNLRIHCPFHEDDKASAWISQNPANGIEYFFCSVDSCSYYHERTHGVNALYFVETNDNLSRKEACEKLFGEKFDGDFYYEPPEIEEVKIPIDFITIKHLKMPKLELDELSEDEANKIYMVLKSDWNKKQHLNIQAQQASGKSHSCSKWAVERFKMGLSTIIFSRCHTELDQLEKRIKHFLVMNKIDTNNVFHMRGISGDDTPRELPNKRPIIVLLPHVYLNRKDDSIYCFEIIKMIYDGWFNGPNNELVHIIIDECGAFIDSRHISRALAGRYMDRYVRGYRKFFPQPKCPIYAGNANCKDCRILYGLTSEGVRGASIRFRPIGQHDFHEDTEKRLLQINLKDLIAEESEMIDKTLNMKCLYGPNLDTLRNKTREEAKLLTGTKEEDRDVDLRLISPQKFFEDIISFMYFPHIIKSSIYHNMEDRHFGRPLNEEELKDRKQNPKNYAVPQMPCEVPFLQGWDYKTLYFLRDKAHMIMMGPQLSTNHENYNIHVFGESMAKWVSQHTFAPLKKVLIVTLDKELLCRKKTIKDFYRELKDASPNSGILNYSPTEREARRDYESLADVLTATFFDGQEHFRKVPPRKNHKDELYQSYSHGPLGAGVDLPWFKIVGINTNTPRPKAALAAMWFIQQSDKKGTFNNLVLEDIQITGSQNMGRIMRVDEDDPEHDITVPRLIFFHGPNAKQVGQFCADYFLKVNHNVDAVHADLSFEFFKAIIFKYLKNEDYKDLVINGAYKFEEEHILNQAKQTIDEHMKDNPDEKWGTIRGKFYNVKKLSVVHKNKIKDWFEEKYTKKRKREEKIAKLLERAEKFKTKNPKTSFEECKKRFNFNRYADDADLIRKLKAILG